MTNNSKVLLMILDGWGIGKVGCDLAGIGDIIRPGRHTHRENALAILISPCRIVDLFQLEFDTDRGPHLLQGGGDTGFVLVARQHQQFS